MTGPPLIAASSMNFTPRCASDEMELITLVRYLGNHIDLEPITSNLSKQTQESRSTAICLCTDPATDFGLL